MTRHDGIFESERAGRITEQSVKHNSGTMRSTPAGGKVDRGQYENKTPRPAGTPTQSLPLKHRNDR
jgi:hypothetical protein